MLEVATKPDAPDVISLQHFLECIHPGKSVRVRGLGQTVNQAVYFGVNRVNLYCETVICQRIQVFECDDNPRLLGGKQFQKFISFTCKNCESTTKTFSLLISLDEVGKHGEIEKYGEIPPFGLPTPARVMTLVGGERDYFLKGRRCENQGLGIAAFAYYRRVVENRSKQIISEIIKVATTIGATKEVLDDLDAAAKEIHFSKAVDAVRHGVPQVLMISGLNPLTLLHSALSEGLHEESDEVCLRLATSIRVILTEMIERMATALKDEAVLTSAVTHLLKVHAAKTALTGPGV